MPKSSLQKLADPAKSSDGVRLKFGLINLQIPFFLMRLSIREISTNYVLIYSNMPIKTSHSISNPFLSKGLLLIIFLAEPIVYTPQENPERIIMVFIDTLRADAMACMVMNVKRHHVSTLGQRMPRYLHKRDPCSQLGHCLPQEQWSQATFQKNGKRYQHSKTNLHSMDGQLYFWPVTFICRVPLDWLTIGASTDV